MTITNGYCTAEDLKSWLGFVDGDDDLLLEASINTASRGIDQYCGTFFYDSGSATARTFTPSHTDHLYVPPITSTSGLVVAVDYGNAGSFGTTLTITTDYVLRPDSGFDASGRAVPYNRIDAIPARYFPINRRPSVEVTAQWGWTSVPDEVYQAALIQASRFYRRRLTPEGFASGEAFGAIRVSSRIDPDVQMMVSPFKLGHSMVV